MSTLYQGHDPQEPPGAEAALETYSAALGDAGRALAAARDAEVEAAHALRAASRRARFSADCPKAGVSGGVRTTVAYVEAWIEDQVADEQLACDLARAARQAAADHLRTLQHQGSIQQTIAKSVTAAYQGTGREPW